MTGQEFKKFRLAIGHTLKSLSDILNLQSKQSLDYYEGKEEVSLIMEMFYNYAQRYGADDAEKEFKRKFRA